MTRLEQLQAAVERYLNECIEHGAGDFVSLDELEYALDESKKP